MNEAVFTGSVAPDYLLTNLGIDVWARTFQGDPALILFRLAGPGEDDPVTRTRNHFHDPLRVWDEAGYHYLFLSGTSNLLWAQNVTDDLSQPNAWTWQQAQSQFLGGLAASSAAERERHFADLFRALGHVTHLVADLSVPAHVRNDSHILGGKLYRTYETWTGEHLTDQTSVAGSVAVFEYPDPWLPEPVVPAALFAEGSVPPYSPVSNLWDSYGPNEDGVPNPALAAGIRPVGLADYTNYNYFSEFTVLDGSYPSPTRTSLQGPFAEQVTDPDGTTVWRLYFRRPASDLVTADHVAAADLLYDEWSRLSEAEQLAVPLHLDDTCWEDYASNLVPRAVSYGVALVDYFFRTRFEVAAVGDALTVTNRSLGRARGAVTGYADAPDGTRGPIPGFEGRLILLAPGESTTFTGFAPPEAGGHRYTLVFEGEVENAGTANNWDCAVAGRVFTWTPPPSFTVCASGCPYASIQAAINAASGGDVIVVGPGDYPGDLNFGGKAITVRSASGPESTTITGSGTAPVVSFRSGESYGAILEGFTITNGNGGNGGGILCSQSFADDLPQPHRG